ncbi:MAG: gamma-glutamylcyclotransferase [Acidobacteria bacterium]|nr:gamma-glutamylcyclotransferase [Acidobacteriota bacterium]MBK8148910.1 gamma-glutamylcyclotransferase [Acidobacteriota bacterium]MBK8811729.1 gamma-glutamylcyclotransferase [Acidobacteriota bacterium]
MQEYLFAYGTLNPDLAPPEIADIVARFEFVRSGTVRGLLFDLGPYRGAVPDAESDRRICGNLYRVAGLESVIDRLDEYEGFRAGDPDRSLFVRSEVTVELAERSVDAQIYVYNGDISDLEPVN